MATQCSRTLIISICNLFLSSYLDTYSNLPFLGSYQQSSCLYTGSYAEPAPFYYSLPVYIGGREILGGDLISRLAADLILQVSRELYCIVLLCSAGAKSILRLSA